MNFINWFPNDYCPSCNSHSLVLMDSYNRPFDINQYDEKSEKVFRKLHCSNCNKNYKIYWIKGTPYPLLNEIPLNQFLQQW